MLATESSEPTDIKICLRLKNRLLPFGGNLFSLFFVKPIYFAISNMRNLFGGLDKLPFISVLSTESVFQNERIKENSKTISQR